MPINKNPSSASIESPKEVPFRFEGKTYQGLAGEPIAKALFRAGIVTLSYSLKYHFPQGIHCGRGRCGRCGMEVNGIPGVPTCITPLEEKMEIRREDFRPFYASLFSAAARKLPLQAGFYYKLFTRPALLRNLFVKSVRRMAGVGRLTAQDTCEMPDKISAGPDALKHVQPRYDIVIVGAGISGLSAALSAAYALSQNKHRGISESGNEHPGNRARILLVDEYSKPGGHSTGYQIDSSLTDEINRISTEIINHPTIDYTHATIAQGLYPPSTLLIAARRGSFDSTGTMKQISARAFIFAAGANDILPLFENNSLPGIFGPRAIRLLLERDGYEFAGPAVVYGTGKALHETTSLLIAKGVDISTIVEVSATSSQAYTTRNMPGNIKWNANTRLICAAGQDWIRSAVFRRIDGIGGRFTIPCALLCMAFKGQGAYELPFHAGFDFHFSKAGLIEEKILLPLQTERINDSGAAYYLAGELTGESDWRHKIEQGKQAGSKAAAFVATRMQNGDNR